MKASALKVRSQSNITAGDEIEMSFDVKNQAKLAAILIDLYSDLWSAIIREYAANGWDSHVSAGQKLPIEITLPTTKDPVFRVKDYGVGMSLEDIREIYSKYGASTKDLDNDQIGAYGLGCKSALSVSPAFTVTAIKNGIKNVVIVSREENSLGKIKPVIQIETDEPNGVEVAIAIDSDFREFASKATQVFFTWPKGSVLIDGKAPSKSIYNSDEFLDLGNDTFMSHERSSGYYSSETSHGLLVNMGGIGYPVVDNQYRLLLDTAMRRGSVSAGSISQHQLIITVPLGSIDLAPSREAIRWSQKSTDTVVLKLKETLGLVVSSIQKKIDAFETREDLFCKDIFELGKSFPDYFSTGDLKWKGEEFPRNFHFEKVPKSGKTEINCAVNYRSGRISTGYYAPEFSFGFSKSSTSVEFVTERRSPDNYWVFIDVQKTELLTSDLHHHIKSLMKARNINNSPVTVAYVFNDILTTNKWLEALLKKENTNLISMTAEELVKESMAFRKEQARRNRMNTKKVEPTYTVSAVIGEEGRKSRTDTVMTPSEIEAILTENPGYQAFADEVIFSTANKEYANNAMFFLPENVIIVYMRGARKADTFVRKVKFPVRVDLASFLAESMVNKIEQVGFHDYFAELHLGYDMCRFASGLNLPEGFLKECFAKENRYSTTRIILDNMNNVKNIDGAIFPEINYVIKSREIIEEGALFFEDPQPWNMSSRSKAYRGQVQAYLVGISDKIDTIVNR